MAFGFKKKKEVADNIYMNGHIYTQDNDYPWATAVACQDGRILAVGDFVAMEEITDEDTNVVDLDGKFLFPGFIEVHDTPVLKAFDGKYLKIEADWDLDTILTMVSDYCEENSEMDTIFAYGYSESIFRDLEDDNDARKKLDAIESQRPVVILGDSGVHIWYNSYTNHIINQALEEDGLPFAPLPYILNLMAPFDFDEIEEAINEMSEELCDKGITSVFNMKCPDYFDELFRDSLIDLINEDEATQRIYDSLYVNRPIHEKTISSKLLAGQTASIEIDHRLNFDFLKLDISSDETGAFFSKNDLETICLAVADKGFNIHLDAKDYDAAFKAYMVFDKLRAKGYKKNTLVIASEFQLDDEDLEVLQYADTIITTWVTDEEEGNIFEQSSSTTEVIDNYTLNAAAIIGKLDSFGSIERGKHADFTVFNDNPIELGMDQFPYIHAEMTIIDGEIVYDAEEAAKDEMYNLLLSQQL